MGLMSYLLVTLEEREEGKFPSSSATNSIKLFVGGYKKTLAAKGGKFFADEAKNSLK